MSVPPIDDEKRLDAAIGQAIRERREALGISQASLGRAIGVTFQQVQKYEQGRNRMAASKLIMAADALKCEASELLGEPHQARRAVDVLCAHGASSMSNSARRSRI